MNKNIIAAMKKFFIIFSLPLLCSTLQVQYSNATTVQPKFYTLRPFNVTDHKFNTDPSFSTIKFAWKLFHSSKQSGANRNLALSPLIIQFLLSILSEGAEGETKYQIIDVIGSRPAGINKQTAERNSGSHLQLKLASGIFLDTTENSRLHPKFIDVNNRLGGNIILADFSNQPEEAKNFINQWAKDRTDGLIPELLNSAYNVRGLNFVLASGIYYKNEWKYKFKNIDPLFFFTNEYGTIGKFVQYMETPKDFYCFTEVKFGNGFSGRLVEIPYKNDEYSMVIIQPDENIYLDNFIRQMDENVFENMIKNLKIETKKKLMRVRLPKFNINSRFSVVNALLKLGLVDLFTRNSNLPYIIQNKSNLQLNDIIQQAILIVDENGTLSASGTTLSLSTQREPLINSDNNDDIIYTIYKPFISIILDKTHSIPIFVSKIFKPVL